MPTLRSLLGSLADLAYPSACAHCHAFCDGAGPLCPSCLGKGLYPYERVGRLCIYDEPAKTLVQQFKYHRRWPLGEWLTERLLEQPRIQVLLKQINLIVPVPLHRRRHFSRGYNQAKVIAARIAKKCKLDL